MPIGLGIARTVQIGKLPVKFNLEVDYSVVRQNSFGPEWLVKFNVTPVIANPLN